MLAGCPGSVAAGDRPLSGNKATIRATTSTVAPTAFGHHRSPLNGVAFLIPQSLPERPADHRRYGQPGIPAGYSRNGRPTYSEHLSRTRPIVLSAARVDAQSALRLDGQCRRSTIWCLLCAETQPDGRASPRGSRMEACDWPRGGGSAKDEVRRGLLAAEGPEPPQPTSLAGDALGDDADGTRN